MAAGAREQEEWEFGGLSHPTSIIGALDERGGGVPMSRFRISEMALSHVYIAWKTAMSPVTYE